MRRLHSICQTNCGSAYIHTNLPSSPTGVCLKVLNIFKIYLQAPRGTCRHGHIMGRMHRLIWHGYSRYQMDTCVEFFVFPTRPLNMACIIMSFYYRKYIPVTCRHFPANTWCFWMSGNVLFWTGQNWRPNNGLVTSAHLSRICPILT